MKTTTRARVFFTTYLFGNKFEKKKKSLCEFSLLDLFTTSYLTHLSMRLCESGSNKKYLVAHCTQQSFLLVFLGKINFSLYSKKNSLIFNRVDWKCFCHIYIHWADLMGACLDGAFDVLDKYNQIMVKCEPISIQNNKKNISKFSLLCTNHFSRHYNKILANKENSNN